MRDLNMGFNDISNLTYPQAYVFMQCLREVNQAHQAEYEKAQAMMKMRGLRQ
jgi:hypothetical protein